MGKSISLRGSKNTKFLGGNDSTNKTVRKNLLLSPSLYWVVRDVVIEEDVTMTKFIAAAIDSHIDGAAESPSIPASSDGVKNTTSFLPRDLAKEVKRTACHAKISENELMVRCLVAKLKTMKDKYPEIIIDIIFKK
jgi:hypothetical protein